MLMLLKAFCNGCRVFVPGRTGAHDEQELQQLALKHKDSKRPNTVRTYKCKEGRWEVRLRLAWDVHSFKQLSQP